MDKEDDADCVEVVYGCKYKYHETQESAVMEEKYQDDMFKYYEIELKLKDVRLSYVFRIHKGKKCFYFSEDGITSTYDFRLDGGSSILRDIC